MKNLILIVCLFFSINESKSQFVIGAAGGEGHAGGLNINFTVGEAVIATISNDSSTLTQGFHQPNLVITSINETFLPGEIAIYPNPTKSIVYAQFKRQDLSELNISIHDFAGKEISNSKVSHSIWETDLSGFPNGFYIVTITDIKNIKRNSYKIFKSN